MSFDDDDKGPKGPTDITEEDIDALLSGFENKVDKGESVTTGQEMSSQIIDVPGIDPGLDLRAPIVSEEVVNLDDENLKTVKKNGTAEFEQSLQNEFGSYTAQLRKDLEETKINPEELASLGISGKEITDWAGNLEHFFPEEKPYKKTFELKTDVNKAGVETEKLNQEVSKFNDKLKLYYSRWQGKISEEIDLVAVKEDFANLSRQLQEKSVELSKKIAEQVELYKKNKARMFTFSKDRLSVLRQKEVTEPLSQEELQELSDLKYCLIVMDNKIEQTKEAGNRFRTIVNKWNNLQNLFFDNKLWKDAEAAPLSSKLDVPENFSVEELLSKNQSSLEEIGAFSGRDNEQWAENYQYLSGVLSNLRLAYQDRIPEFGNAVMKKDLSEKELQSLKQVKLFDELLMVVAEFPSAKIGGMSGMDAFLLGRDFEKVFSSKYDSVDLLLALKSLASGELLNKYQSGQEISADVLQKDYQKIEMIKYLLDRRDQKEKEQEPSREVL